jgi:hypothetical protein
MLRRVALVRTDVSEEFIASFIRVTRIGELGTTLAVTSNRCTLWQRAVLTRATRRNIPEDTILQQTGHYYYVVFTFLSFLEGEKYSHSQVCTNFL